MEELVLFIMCFIFVFMLYRLFIVLPVKRNKKTKDKKIKKNKKYKDKEIVEIKYLQAIYKIDIDKVDYKKLVNICCFVSSLDISLIVSFMEFIDNFLLKIICTIIFSVCIIIFSYHLVYLYLRRKMK